MDTLRPLIKWSGSKRSQAKEIISYFPAFTTYYEPFLGGGSVLGLLKPKKAVAGDTDEPLIALWKAVQERPSDISKKYRKDWQSLQNEGYEHYYYVRKKFNDQKLPHQLLFLTRTCVNGLIRYNSKGEFNNSLHHTRPGIDPDTLEEIVLEWSLIIKNYRFMAGSYEHTTKSAKPGDFIYLDPPYFNTKGRYSGAINYEKFLGFLENLNERGIKFALSYDGHRGDKSYLVELPKKLYKRHILLHSGNSTFNKIQNKKVEKVYESLYLNF